MTTAVTSPAGSGARASESGRRLFGLRWRRWWLAATAVAAAALVVGGLLVASDLQARTEIRTTDLSLSSADHRLGGLRTELARAELRLDGARARRAAVTRSFDAAQSALSATQKSLFRAEAGIHSQGVDLGMLDACVSAVEQALNQIAVGQTSGGLATLRATSSSCSALNEAV